MKFILMAENHTLYSSKRLMDEARILGLEVDHLNPYQYSIDLSPLARIEQRGTILLHRSTGIRFDDFDLMISTYFQECGATVANPLPTLRQLRDKLSQHFFFYQHNLPALPSYALRGKIDEKELNDVANRFAQLAKSERYILKTERGNKGIGVNLLESKKSLFGLMETFWGMQDQRFILQPFIPGDEYRVLIIGGDISGIIHKQSSDEDYRKNANRSEGIYCEIDSVPQKVLQTAKECYKHSGAIVAGIDLIYSQENTYILECNLVPGFELMEKLSGKNHAREIIISCIDQQRNTNETRT